MSFNISFYCNYAIYSTIHADKIITDEFNCNKLYANEGEFNNLKVNNNTITKNIVVSNYSTLNDVSLNNLTSYNITNTNLISTKDLEVDNNTSINGNLTVNNINSNNINNSNLITTNDLTYSTDYKNCKLYYVNSFNNFWGYATSASYTNNYLYLSLVSGSSTISGYTRTYKKYFVYKCFKDANNFYFDEIELDNNSLVYNVYSKKLYFVNDVNGTKFMKCLSIGQGTYRDYGLSEYGEIFNDYDNNKAYDYSHAEGRETEALSSDSHAEGYQTKANGLRSHAEGYKSESNSYCSHAEGYNTKANSYYSHAEGYETETKKYYTHAGGLGTTADQECQTAIGKYNIKNNTDSLFSIGNGTDDNNRSDAFNVYQNGNCNINNDLTVNNNITTTDLTASNITTTNLNVDTINADNINVSDDLTLTNNIIYDNDYKNNRILIISNYFYGSDTTNINTQDKYYLCISTNGSYTQNKIYQCLTLSPLSTTEITPEDFLIIFVEIDKRYFIYFNNNWSCINNGKFLINNVLKNSIIFNDNTNNYTNGVYNTIFGYNNSVSNGNANDIIVGGSSNSISGDAKNSLVMGTNNKLPSASYSCFIIGSQNEITSYMDRSIIYGFQNKNNNGDSLDCLLGGYQNTIHDCDTSIISGTGNNYKSVRNSLLFGQSNTSTASNASNNNIFGGNNNNIDTITSTNNIISGNSNTLQTNNTSNSIISGISNVIDGLNNSIVSGNTNNNQNMINSLIYGENNNSTSTITSECNIFGGYSNQISNVSSIGNIISGNLNVLENNDSMFNLIEGQNNKINNFTCCSVVGCNNTNENMRSCLLYGDENQATPNNRCENNIYGGYQNNIDNITVSNSIISGSNNHILYKDFKNSLMVGQNHYLEGGQNAIIGGMNNYVNLYIDPPANYLITGKGNYVSESNEVCFGQYNKYQTGLAFSIGQGTDDNNRKNIFQIKKNGQTKLRELSFYDDVNDEEIISFDGYVRYYLNNGLGDKQYRVISHVIVDLTTFRGYFWSSPIFLPESTSSTLGFGWADFKCNGKTYNFNCISVLNNNQSCGCCLTSANWQGTDYVKVNALKSNNGYNWQSFQDQYYNHAWPMIQMEGIIMHLVNIT